jgi:hypothetical protein
MIQIKEAANMNPTGKDKKKCGQIVLTGCM